MTPVVNIDAKAQAAHISNVSQFLIPSIFSSQPPESFEEVDLVE